MGCTGTPAVGVYGKLLIEPGSSPHTFDSSSERYEILRTGKSPAEDIVKHGRLIGGQGIWGGLYPLSTRVRDGAYYMHGSFTLNPSAGYFDTLLQYLVGDLDTGVNYPNNCPNDFGMLIYRDLDAGSHQKSFEVKDCLVDWWELSGERAEFGVGEGIDESAADLLTLRIGVIGKSEASTSWPGTEPSFPEGATYYPYAMHDVTTVTLNGSARKLYGFTLRYDNQLRVEYASGSQTPQSIFSTGRKVTLDMRLPWCDDNDDLYTMDYTGAAASIDITMGSYGTKFDITNFKAPPMSPFIYDKNEVYFAVRGQAFGPATAASTTKEFYVTNDTTA